MDDQPERADPISPHVEPNPEAEALWRSVFTGDAGVLRRNRHIFRLIPSEPRCSMCNAPFGGIGRVLMEAFYHKRPSVWNPRFCNVCEDLARKYPGGAEIEMSFLFADVRGSTTIAETMSPAEFSRLLNRFYTVATSVLSKHDAMVDKFVGDEVIGLFPPSIAGPDHARVALNAARELLTATGHGRAEGPWLPVGAGVHTGTAFIGPVGSESVMQITALGDTVNTTARLASKAETGEILISDAAYEAAGLDLGALEHRSLELKGRVEPLGVRVLRVSPQP